MLVPEKPADEAFRLASLRELGILDTGPEERFDRLTRLAQRLFNVPVALVSLVDADRQWFKSRQGIDATETPRAVSFCGHAILDSEPFVIPDAMRDVRFRDNPLVTGQAHIRFYAGHPLRLPNGARVGTLCIVDHVPRQLDEQDLQALRDLAAIAEGELAALQLAITDELTQVTNRRGFECVAAHSLELCRRQDFAAHLLYFDLDGFKQINDTLGHAAGDLTLGEFATALSRTFRGSDVIGRLGGDEFAVLVADTDDAGLDKALARLQQMLRHRELRPGRSHGIDYSVGIVAFDPSEHDDLTALMRDADEKMYRMKMRRKKSA
jgi:diguanylate cyclase (GGDEF)-like protein